MTDPLPNRSRPQMRPGPLGTPMNEDLIELVGGSQDGAVYIYPPSSKSYDAEGEWWVWDGQPDILRPDNSRLRRFVLTKETP